MDGSGASPVTGAISLVLNTSLRRRAARSIRCWNVATAGAGLGVDRLSRPPRGFACVTLAPMSGIDPPGRWQKRNRIVLMMEVWSKTILLRFCHQIGRAHV